MLHTVGPMNCSEKKLRSCYERCLELALANDIRSVVSVIKLLDFLAIIIPFVLSASVGLSMYSNWNIR